MATVEVSAAKAGTYFRVEVGDPPLHRYSPDEAAVFCAAVSSVRISSWPELVPASVEGATVYVVGKSRLHICKIRKPSVGHVLVFVCPMGRTRRLS